MGGSPLLSRSWSCTLASACKPLAQERAAGGERGGRIGKRIGTGGGSGPP